MDLIGVHKKKWDGEYIKIELKLTKLMTDNFRIFGCF